MKLWLDDVREPPIGWIWVKSYEGAIYYLTKNSVWYISLDHDLGENKKTGYDLACWIEEKVHLNIIKKPIMLCHSQNPVGKRRILQVIEKLENLDVTYEDRRR